MSIRKFIKTIRKASVDLTDNGLFRRVNEAIEKMLNVKISPLGSTQRPQTQEDEESASQAQFWEQAEICLQKIEKTIKEKTKKESPSHSFGVQEKSSFDAPLFDMGISPIRSPNVGMPSGAREREEPMGNVQNAFEDVGMHSGAREMEEPMENFQNAFEDVGQQGIDLQERLDKAGEKNKGKQVVQEYKRKSKLSEYRKSPFKTREININEKPTNLQTRFYDWLINKEDEEEVVFQIGLYVGKKKDFSSLQHEKPIKKKVIDMFTQFLNAQENLKSSGKPLRFFMAISDVSAATHTKNVNRSQKSTWFNQAMKQNLEELKINKFEDIEMLFFPIEEFEQYYVIAINLKNPRIDILDNDSSGSDLQETYKYTPTNLRALVVDFLRKKKMYAKAILFQDDNKVPFTRLEMSWRDSENKIDSGILAMRHMETYFGNGLTGWKTDLTEGNRKQIENMRVKYGATMIGNQFNEIKIDMMPKSAAGLRQE